MSNHKQIEAVIQMYSTLSADPIENLIADDMTYESAWVILPIEGKLPFLYFIRKKLKTIKMATNAGLIRSVVSKISLPGFEDEEFILLKYKTRRKEKEILIRVKVEGSMIKSIQLFPKNYKISN